MNSKDLQAAQGLLQQLLQRQKNPHQITLRSTLPVQASVISTAPVNISASTSAVQAKTPSYVYKVKVINPSRKSDVVLSHLNGHTEKFGSVSALKMKLIEEFGDQVPGQLNFSVGYFDGSQQAKTWLVTKEKKNKPGCNVQQVSKWW